MPIYCIVHILIQLYVHKYYFSKQIYAEYSICRYPAY